MRSIFHPATPEEAVKLRHEIDGSAYLAGGTEIMRLGSSIPSDCALIDVSKLPLSGIREDEGFVIVGALTTLEEIRNSELVPDFIREAAASDASLQLRNAATIGGNFALRRFDSYMLPSILASQADVTIMCSKGLKRKSAAEYFEKKECRAVVMNFVIDENRIGSIRRIARASHMHAAVIRAESCGCWAYTVSGSGIAYGHDKDVYKSIDFKDDLTGSASYKRYLASVLAEEGESGC